MKIDDLTFAKGDTDKVHALCDSLFPPRYIDTLENTYQTSVVELYEHSIRRHTIVSILAEMQKREAVL